MTQATTSLPAPAPQINTESKKFWDATLEGKLLLPRCNSCQSVIWFPREYCPECMSFEVTWFEASGKGKIYSYSITRRGQGDYQGIDGYVLAYVELEEGPRMLTNIVDADFADIKVGKDVKVKFENTGKGAALPRFTLA